ncbi:exonuclease subunit SbcD [Erwinia persicina]|uniref:Nuclease SbcCD subunit D n=1 Tax=Erwinia persicina TaxID=55211 RepID=A0A4U3EWU8_9GAMM|nr:exonuclease subunit SbcD [Erwinia persicina]MBD8106342.1 exonuclease subunit SbcD [Erwinia persicina]MBD8209286.1 exonuclease subunit SbcD [Erwinia persicina]MCQ4094662.1 exonuclease subunit SbcD [Erwinia persicina]MCQ4102623.1 exonuclease subunit SbcD [Erwinia persicina]MCQ4105507.1 exonuclease subunit SbcD [Erwinia persicina]
MRIIHTADWHLGQFFYTKSRAAEHQAFLDWLLEKAEAQQADAIIVAGDIFDTGSPPSYARELYNRFVVRLQQTGCQLVILGGNHDSVAMLNESRELLACLNTRVIAAASDDVSQQVLMLNRRDGQPGALLCAIPFLRPRDILRSQSGQSGREKQQSLLEAITDHYQRCWQEALRQREALGLTLPIIATGHLTTLGVTKSDAVRDIYIGTLDAFPADCFPPADYIALGHIHRAQRIANSDHIRYSGSPIPLSFDELGKAKNVFQVDFDAGRFVAAEALPIPSFQPMQMIKGSLEQIEQQLAALTPDPQGRTIWLDIEIVTEAYLSELQRRIQELTAPLPVEVVLLRRSREQREQVIARQNNETLSELSVEEVFSRRLAQETDEPERQARASALFAQTLEAVRHEEQP